MAMALSIDADQKLSQVRDGILKTLDTDPISPKSQEQRSEMTGGRLFARFLSRFQWYYPRNGTGNLDDAWHHYEYSTLARVYKDVPGYVRAPHGENERPTRLYPLFATPLRELGDWGFSVRMYFSTLLVLSLALFISGLLNVPLAVYFWKYSSEDAAERKVPFLVRASALCMDRSWEEDLQMWRNDCNFDDWLIPGLFSYGASVLLVVQLCFVFFWLQRKAEIVFDEQQQTASDYSIKISNPPKDATDPAEWKQFLDRFAADSQGVTYCTVAIDNAKLLRKLVDRRKLLQKLSRKIPTIDVLDREVLAAAVNIESEKESIACFGAHFQSMWEKLLGIEAEIEPLLSKTYQAVAVFAIFENERSQRNALHCLSSGRFQQWRNQTNATNFLNGGLKVKENAESSSSLACGNLVEDLLKQEEQEEHEIKLMVSNEGSLRSVEKYLRFRGTQAVKVKEACEPNNVRWLDLEVPYTTRFLQLTATTIAMIWFICWSAFFIHNIESSQPGSNLTAWFIAVTNIIVPKLCEFINNIESHSTEASRQASMYTKIALFRWFNSAISLTLVIRFTNSIALTTSRGNSLNEAVYNLIFAELFTAPLLKLCDIVNFARKHIFAPRATNQEEMNAYFVGGRMQLAERYTDATKVVFVALFYSTILPESLFLGSVALLIHFIIGKFCLLRLCRTASDVGTSLSRLSRNIFFSSSLLVHLVASSYWWSGFPFDNVCEAEDGSLSECNQDFLRSLVFPPLPKFQTEGQTWMTSSQEVLVSLYVWTSLVFIGVAVLSLARFSLVSFVTSFFGSIYEPDGKDQMISFSSVKHRQEVEGYIPQLPSGFSRPLIACNSSAIDEDLLPWKAPNMSDFNLCKDVKELKKQFNVPHDIGPSLAPIGCWPVSK